MDPGPQAGLNGTLVDRYYDPATGQFLTVDPLVGQTGQAYAYAGDDPVNETDPTGTSWWNPLSWGRHAENVGEIIAGVAIGVGTGVIVVAAAVLFFPEDLPAVALEGTFLGAEIAAVELFSLGLILQGAGLGGGTVIKGPPPKARGTNCS
jgi:hypothetical protein